MLRKPLLSALTNVAKKHRIFDTSRILSRVPYKYVVNNHFYNIVDFITATMSEVEYNAS